MQTLLNLGFIISTSMIINCSTAYAAEVFDRRGDAAPSQRLRSQFDPRFSEEYIKKEKKEAHKQGFEEGVEKGIEKGIEQGRREEAKSMALRMLAKGMLEKEVANLTELPLEHVQELKASLKTDKGV